MRKTLYAFIILACILEPSLSLSATQELMGTGVNMQTHPVWINGHSKLYQRMAELSGDKAKMIYYNPNAICPEAEVLASIQKGVLQFGQLAVAKNPNIFPAYIGTELPFLFSSARAACAASYKIATSSPFSDEFDKANMRLLIGGTSAPLDLLSVKPIARLEDIRGLKIGAGGAGAAEIIKALGAVPVIISYPDAYLGLQRSTLDAVLMPVPQYRTLKLPEVAKHMLKCSIATTGSATVLNKDVYNAFAPDVKKAFDQVFGLQAGMLNGTCVDKFTVEDQAYMEQNMGLKVTVLDEQGRQAFRNALAPLTAAWKARVAKLGVDADAAYAVIQKWADHYNNLETFNKEYETYKETLGPAYIPGRF
ncbi:MAG: TRAP transporter substrate-binding protein DctP [Deltaproteobacteria bacterium]|jgi:TRAP-type C4-dicarboxylate transport system substrate-binding protein|nr:TRAP transporter substrate-binding protein DctP [Deltaproteobacteria bacterium]